MITITMSTFRASSLLLVVCSSGLMACGSGSRGDDGGMMNRRWRPWKKMTTNPPIELIPIEHVPNRPNPGKSKNCKVFYNKYYLIWIVRHDSTFKVRVLFLSGFIIFQMIYWLVGGQSIRPVNGQRLNVKSDIIRIS